MYHNYNDKHQKQIDTSIDHNYYVLLQLINKPVYHMKVIRIEFWLESILVAVKVSMKFL